MLVISHTTTYRSHHACMIMCLSVCEFLRNLVPNRGGGRTNTKTTTNQKAQTCTYIYIYLCVFVVRVWHQPTPTVGTLQNDPVCCEEIGAIIGRYSTFVTGFYAAAGAVVCFSNQQEPCLLDRGQFTSLI